MNRRHFLTRSFAFGSALASGVFASLAARAEHTFEAFTLSEDALRKKLTPQQFRILRKEGTERPYTSELNEEKREGMYACAGCGLDLFPSSYKFDSGTGWPSFYDAIDGHIGTKTDYKLLVPRTEYHCARCGGHHGHVFEDGPEPTGLRYCNNGAVLTFTPKDEA